jgi:predicted dehydrogenase
VEVASEVEQNFIHCLERGTKFEISGAETLKTMTLVYAAYLSAEEGRVVDREELLRGGKL